jgi:DNA-binding NarL/FixJ family response regulator
VTASPPIRLLIVDDHALVRSALAEQFRSETDIDLVATASDGEEAVQAAMVHKPDVVIMDIDMPGVAGFDAARRIHDDLPGTRLIFLSAFIHDRYVEEALGVQAMGYLTKREGTATLLRAVREVAAGGAFFSDEVRSRIVVGLDGAVLAGDARSRASTLTARELEILRHIASGLTKKRIADEMSLSIKTVERHADNMMQKLNIHDRVELTRFALREGLIEA